MTDSRHKVKGDALAGRQFGCRHNRLATRQWLGARNASTPATQPTPAMMAGVVDSLWTFDDLFDRVMG